MVTNKKPPANAQPCESNGQTWWLSEINSGIRKAFSSLVRMRARQQLIEDKEAFDEIAYRAEWKLLQGRIDAGAYEWGPPLDMGGTGPGEAVREAMGSDEGSLRLTALLLAESHEGLTLGDVNKIIDGNPEGMAAAVRSALGLDPLASTPDKETGKQTTTETPAA